MDETPVYVNLWTDGTTCASAQATSKSASSITERLFGASGTALASTAVSFYYEAVGARA
jgi:hypothetical protein